MSTIIKKKHLGLVLLPFYVASVLLLQSCDDQLDIVPKGKSTLENVTDLELILNQEYNFGQAASSDIGVICNEGLGAFVTVPEVLSQPNTVDYANYTYNEIIDRGVLAISDVRYESAYKYINYMNVLLNKLLDAQGDEVKKKQLVAEAHVIRAWLHFLLVNIYAKQYDAGTADKEGGIPYVEDVDVSQEKTKLTLEETYRHILADLADDIIAELPDESNNVERADKAFAYAAKAYVLMQMKRYADAIPYAQASLKINNTIDARETLVQSGAWIITQNAANNLLYIGGSGRVSLTFDVISKETWEKFEDGDYVVNYDAAGGWSTFMGPMMSGIEGISIRDGRSRAMSMALPATTSTMFSPNASSERERLRRDCSTSTVCAATVLRIISLSLKTTSTRCRLWRCSRRPSGWNVSAASKTSSTQSGGTLSLLMQRPSHALSAPTALSASSLTASSGYYRSHSMQPGRILHLHRTIRMF